MRTVFRDDADQSRMEKKAIQEKNGVLIDVSNEGVGRVSSVPFKLPIYPRIYPLFYPCFEFPQVHISVALKLRPEGFEPPTYGSEDHCSIQLSYGREWPLLLGFLAFFWVLEERMILLFFRLLPKLLPL
jgi:hypothetical protein